MRTTTSVILLFVFWGCTSEKNPAGNSGANDEDAALKIGGVINAATTLDERQYQVTSDLTVASGATLTIEAGARLLFVDGSALIIEGRLQCVGTNERRIEFLPFGDVAWGGIRFRDADGTSVMQFCKIEGGELTDRTAARAGAIDVVRSDAEIRNCIIQNCHSDLGGGLYAIQARVEVLNCIFRNNQAITAGGGMHALESEIAVINNTFFENQSVNFGGGLVVAEQVTSNIQNNIFFENTGTAGDPRIAILSGGTENYIEQFNFLAQGDMAPLFRSREDLHLSLGSPAIDMGNPAPEFNDWDGTRNDQGAYGGPGGNW